VLIWLLIPTALSLPTDVARQALSAPLPEGLALHPHALHWAGGTVVRFSQSLDGLEVLGSGPRVSLNTQSEIRSIHGRTLGKRPDTLTPTLRAPEAVLRAQDALFIDPSESLWPGRSRLAVFHEGESQLVWVVDLSRALPFQTWQVLVDAVDGTIVHAELTSQTAEGTVFPESPLHSDPLNVTLDNLTSSERLAGVYAEAFSCVEWDIDPKPFGRRDCLEISPTASPDYKNNYHYDPAYGALDDPFSEVHTYFHTDRISRWADERWGIHLGGPIRVLTNFPLTNAFYGDFDGDGRRDISFGISDDGFNFAYDSDVIYHEFGHAIVRTLAGSMGMSADEIGIDWTSGALNEGTADLFSMVLNGDPLLAEYLGQSERWDTAIRDLDPDRRCPDDLQSQVHRSGEILGSVGWNLIEVMGTELVAELLVGALSTWSNQTDWAAAGHSLSDAATDLHTAGEIDASTLAQAEDIIAASGMRDCTRIIDLSQVETSRQYLLNLGLDDAYARFPTAVQFSLVAPPEATALLLDVHDFDGAREGTGWTIYIRAGAPVEHQASKVEGVGLAFAEPVEFDLSIDGRAARRTIRLDAESQLALVPGEIYYFALASRNLSREALDIDYSAITISGTILIGGTAQAIEKPTAGCHTSRNLPSGPLGFLLPLALIRRRRTPPPQSPAGH